VTKTLPPLLTLLGVSVAHAGPLAVEIKPATSTWHQKKPVDVTLKVTNTSKTEVTFKVMGCSWEEHWRSSDRELTWQPWDCDKNAPSNVALAPGKAREWKLSMFATENAAPGAHSLEMTFTPRDGTPTKSSAVTITVTR
jgi:uncharacterized cupredoxin-like copper-binding protein